MATSQDFVNWVCGDKLNNHFLKYVLILERQSLNMFSMGTTHQTIYYPEVKAFHVAIPPRPEQDAIVSVLAALDDKIELNRQTNETLEALARAIFKDWFVDFGPTRAKAEGRPPYLAPELWNLFPDALDDEDKPEGWEEKPLDEIAEFLNGLALQKFPASDGEDSLPVIKIAELRGGISAKSNRASRDLPEKYVVTDGDFLFSWSGSLLAKFWTEGEGALNQHLFKVTSDRSPAWFFSQWVYHHLEAFQAIAASKATTMGHIQRGHLNAAMTTCPPDDVLPKLGQIVAPLVDACIKNELESRTLAQTRDLLLPKLMSGEIRLREAEELVEAVA
jgi:type I restriction enzyme S subunit